MPRGSSLDKIAASLSRMSMNSDKVVKLGEGALVQLTRFVDQVERIADAASGEAPMKADDDGR